MDRTDTHRAVVFDMDGVLVDSQQYWTERECEVIFPKTIPDGKISPEDIRGMNVSEVFEYITTRSDVAVSREEFLDMYHDAAETIYTQEVRLLKGFPAFRRELEREGIACGLASSSPRQWIDYVLERFELSFGVVLSGDEIEGPSKPAPDIYRQSVSDLGVSPEVAIAVEDATHGIEAATRAGLTTVGFETDDGSQDLSSATYVVNGPEALYKRLCELTGLEPSAWIDGDRP